MNIEPTYNVEVEFDNGTITTFEKVILDGIDQERACFYQFVFEDRTTKLIAIGRILGMNYGHDRAAYIDYWRQRTRQD